MVQYIQLVLVVLVGVGMVVDMGLLLDKVLDKVLGMERDMVLGNTVA